MDIGNTSVSMSRWELGERVKADRIATEAFDSVVELLQKNWDVLGEDSQRAVVLCSVCPSVLERLRLSCQKRRIGPLLVVGEDLDLPIGVDLAEPLKVGTDRICAAAGAYIKVKSACVVADFGTALTIDLVSDNGVFLGGTIMPGLALSAKALHEHTALLPLVELGSTDSTLGKDTQSAIRNGIFAMFRGALREVVECYATDIGRWPPLILTGGDARLLADACDFVDHVCDDLSLDGLILAYQQHVEQNDGE
jgi:type III pantothenate kinase